MSLKKYIMDDVEWNRPPVRPLTHALIVDGESLIHAAYHKFCYFRTPEGKPTGVVFGFFKQLQSYLIRFYPKWVYITFDNGRSQYRLDLHPDYKKRRVNIRVNFEELQAQKRVVMRMLEAFRIPYIYDKDRENDYEGDDYVAYLLCIYLPLVKKINRYNSRFILVTSDKDFNQLLDSDLVKVYNRHKDIIVSTRNCKEIFGYSSTETVDFLSVVGDRSDGIGGIPGIGAKRMRAILDKYGTFSDYLYQNPDPEYARIYNRNRKLIDLVWFIKNRPLNRLPLKEYKDNNIRWERLYKYFESYSLSTFTERRFLKPFKDLHLPSFVEFTERE